MPFSLRHLTIERTAFFVIFIMLFAMATRVVTDTDMWWHLRLGQHILETGETVYADTFSHTYAGEIHRNHSAGAQVVMYAVWSLAGNLGMALFTSVLATSGMFFLYKAGTGTIYMQAFLLIFGAATAATFWSARPQMFSFLFGTIVIYILFAYKRRGHDRLLWLIPVMWLWGNTHGGFAIAYIFIGAFVVGEFLNTVVDAGDSRIPMRGIGKLILVTIVATALLVINPNGLNIFAVPFETFGIQELRRFIQEWQSPDFNQRFTWGFVILLATTIGAVWSSKRKFDWTDWFLVCGTTFMALMAARNLSVFATVAVPIATYHFDSVLQHNGWVLQRKEFEHPRRAKLNLVLLILVMIGALANILVVADSETVYEGQSAVLPIEAVNHLNEIELDGKMFNSYNWGGYLMFNAPQYPVFIDGRTDLYITFLNDYFRVAIGGDTWRDDFDEWDISFAVIETGSGLAEELANAPDWLTEYQDDLASIFVKEVD